MTGEERREEIINQLCQSAASISASKLAKGFSVSRQVVVQDIALLRARGYHILSTNRGYVLNNPSQKLTRVFKVSHTDRDIEDELTSIIDLGGCVEDVFVNHRVYGTIQADLNIDSRRKVKAFLDEIKSGKSSPLKNITSNYHYHTVSSDTKETLDLIESMLKAKNYLVQEL